MSRQVIEEVANIDLHENPYSGCRVETSGQTADGQTDRDRPDQLYKHTEILIRRAQQRNNSTISVM